MKMLEQYSLYLYFFPLSLVTIFLYKWLTLRKAAVKNLPPSPPKVPIIGNLHQIGPDPHVSLRDLAQKYGPLMLLKFGSVPVLVVSSADAAQEILKTNDLVFADRPILSVANRIFYNGRDVAFARYSEYWKQVKSACVTHLLSSSRVHSFHDVREEEVALLIQNIEHPHSKLVNLSDLLADLTNNVVRRVALGRKYESVQKGNSYKILVEELMKMLGYSRSIGDFFPWLGWVDWLSGLNGKVEKAAKEIDTFLEGVLRDHPSTTASNKEIKQKFYNGRDVAFARYSEYWKQVKSACVTHLLSSSRVHSFHDVREEEVALLIQNIEHPHSKLVNLSDLLADLTNNVVRRVALGRKYESVQKGNSYKILVEELMKMLGYSRSIGDFFPWLGWVDWLSGLNGKVEKAANEIDTFLEGVLRDHPSTTASNNGCANKDFVSILLEIQNTDAGFSIDRECIKALILDTFVAGTETTSTTLEWTIAALIKSPHVMFRLQNEVREIGKGKSKILEGDLVKMNYLKAVMKESLRLYFTVPLLVPRVARQDVKLMGYDIRSGTQVLINAWAIARDPSLWDNPEEFRPERFLNSPIDYKGLHYEYLPFGAGRRG